MRVVDVGSFFSDSCGGIKTYYRAKARFLPPLGVDCHFVVPGARREETPFGGGLLHRIPGPPLPGNGHYRAFGRLGELGRLLRRLAPDVIEIGSHTFLPGIVRRALDELPGPRPRVVGFFHSDVPGTVVEPFARRLPAALGRHLVDRAWRFVRERHDGYDATLVASRVVEQRLRARGIPRVAWVGLGVDVDTFRPAHSAWTERSLLREVHRGRAREPSQGSHLIDGEIGPPILVYAGRLSDEKDFPLVLAAYDAIAAATRARLRIIGDGPGRAAAERFAATRPGVTVEGYVDSPAALAAILARADAVLTPGARETFSLATAEALACATPVVAADQGGAQELCAGSGGGVCFRAGDAGALAAATIDLLRRPRAERRALGARGRAHVARALTWQAVMGRIHARYASLLGEPVDPEQEVAA